MRTKRALSRDPLSRDPAVRLAPFLEHGLIERIPTTWQLVQGQLEMMPYVILPDDNDDDRYAGAPLGHPLLRTPLILGHIGLDHFRVGHGLHAKLESLIRHLSLVYHAGFPTFDLQLVHTVPGGLAALRRYTQEIEEGATPLRARQRRMAGWIIPDAPGYRRRFLEPGGWIDRAEAFDYPPDDEAPAYLRREFSSLTGFVRYCAEAFPERPRDTPNIAGHLVGLLRRRFATPRT